MSGVIRVEKTSNYTTMSNTHLRDPRLSLRAIGLMSRMLSNADTYEYSVAGLTASCLEGRDAIRKALKELEDAGYLIREQQREGGAFAKCDYTLYEQPRSPLTENPTTVNPTSVKPTTGNPPQRNTNVKNKQEKENPPKAPQEGAAPAEDVKHTPRKRQRLTGVPVWKPDRFEKFWNAYPRGEAKQAAVRAWDKLKADDDLLTVMGRALLRQMRSEEWIEGVGIPYASTWLNQRRWEDEPPKHLQPVPDPSDRPILDDSVAWV